MRILLVRPWIHDFSAYDLWIQPLGLLYLAAVLIENGFEVQYIDCLDSHSQLGVDGRGKFTKKGLATPEPLQGTRRYYGRFGITSPELQEQLRNLQRPDAILVTSGMTYWYPGVQDTIRHLRERYGDTRIILGGIYATLMPLHAKVHSGADEVVVGEFENHVVSFLTNGRCKPAPRTINEYPFPAWHLTRKIPYRILMTSRGCPYRCTFCASDILNEQRFLQRNIHSVLAEISEYHFVENIEHFVFYDDALLINHKKHFQPLLEQLIRRGIRAKFHTPNGLNAREIDRPIAELMRATGFSTIRLSLESVNPEIQKVQGNSKVTNDLFERAVRNLYDAGYKDGDLECYLIQGLPGQTADDVLKSLDFVSGLGVIARLATYSPIPGTPEAEEARKRVGDDFLTEPLFQNHSIFPLRNTAMTEQDLGRIKLQCNENNQRIRERTAVAYSI